MTDLLDTKLFVHDELKQELASIVSGLLPPLLVPTPQAWCELAVTQLDLLLIDHAHCEKKAASSAMNLIYRYPEHYALVQKMSRLAREELRHLEQVLQLAKQHHIHFKHLSPSRYAGQLHTLVRTHEPARLIDSLILGAFIEARSCERFAALIPYLPDWLGGYYQRLLKSEARHFSDYLTLAEQYHVAHYEKQNEAKGTQAQMKTLAKKDFQARIDTFAQCEADLITSKDPIFRFHSGIA